MLPYDLCIMEERLQKIIAGAGLTSRRMAEEWIKKGRVSVNGLTVDELGAKADPERDEIRVDGNLVSALPEEIYVMVHKPEGYVTTTKDPEGRDTVMQLVKRIKRRVFPVGRLDYNTSGLLLMTSDGELTRFLTHPGSEVEKTYQVKVRDKIGDDDVNRLREGPDIGGKPLKPSKVNFLKYSRKGAKHSWIEMTITEGRTRQIRSMCEEVGHPVMKLKRVAVGPLSLGTLPVGEWRLLTDKEEASLKRLMKKKGKEKGKSGKGKRKKADA